MTAEELKILIKLKNMAMDIVNGTADELTVTLDDREFIISGEQAKGAAKGILMACKCFEMNDGI